MYSLFPELSANVSLFIYFYFLHRYFHRAPTRDSGRRIQRRHLQWSRSNHRRTHTIYILQSQHHRFSEVASAYARFNENQTRSSSPVLRHSSTRSYAFTALIIHPFDMGRYHYGFTITPPNYLTNEYLLHVIPTTERFQGHSSRLHVISHRPRSIPS